MLLEIEHRETDSGIVVIRLAGKLMLGPESQQVESLVLLHAAGGDCMQDIEALRQDSF